MSSNCVEYKGFLGSVEFDPEAGVLHGRIEFIEDLVTFEGTTVPMVVREFKAAVDDYLATCKEVGREPDVPFKGTFNVRVGPELHKRAAMAAKRSDRSLNDFVKEAVERCLENEGLVMRHVHEHKHEVVQIQPVEYSPFRLAGDKLWTQLARPN